MAAVLTWIPGFREIRTPLIVGYLLLASGWLVFEPDIPSSCGTRVSSGCADRGVWHTVYRAFEGLAPIAPFIALSFAAFLLGSVFMTVVGERIQALVEPVVSDDLISTLENSLLGLSIPGEKENSKTSRCLRTSMCVI